MSAIAPEILALAEMLGLYLPLPPGRERVDAPRFTAFVHHKPDPHRNMVVRLRLAPDEVEATVAEVRALYRARGNLEVTWEVGPSSTPSDLAERLLALGMTRDPDPELAGMVLRRPPASAGVVVPIERVTTFEGFRAHRLIYHRSFAPPGAPAPPDAEIAEDFERRRGREDYLVRYLALQDGAPVAAADAIFVEHGVVLCGGATLPEARGRGLYRALVQRRWDDAVARGTPVLVVQAGAMSRPILERLGFEEVTRVAVLRDRFED